MKFLQVALVLLALFATLFTVEARRYQFVTAKCVEHNTNNQIDGPLKICTFPPKHTPVPQDEINAVIQHIQTLKLD
uniref:Uncharacterized protein n=1 Tax=Musca domestica TaxID=7370 RepID=A0A1I8NAQ8_MUSDO